MLKRLSAGPASVSELVWPLSMSLPAVLQHLAVLEAADLAISRKQGRVRICEINATALCAAQDWLTARRAGWEHRLDRLETYLTERQNKDQENE